MTRELEIGLETRIENVPLAGVAIAAVVREAGFGETTAFELRLAAVEALTNVVRHGHRGEPGHRVTARVRLAEGQVDLHILDAGLAIPARHLAAPEPEVDPTNLEGLAEGGRGLFLIRRLVDELHYRPGPPNEMHLVRRRRQSE